MWHFIAGNYHRCHHIWACSPHGPGIDRCTGCYTSACSPGIAWCHTWACPWISWCGAPSEEAQIGEWVRCKLTICTSVTSMVHIPSVCTDILLRIQLPACLWDKEKSTICFYMPFCYLQIRLWLSIKKMVKIKPIIIFISWHLLRN